MHENNYKKFIEFLKRILYKLRPKFSFHYIAYTTLFIIVIFSVIQLAQATTPNPGHPWSELGDGVFVFTSGQTSTPYTYTFPANNVTVLTTGAAVTLGQGGTGAVLSDPGAHKIMGWDDTDNATSYFTIGSNLNYDHTSHTLSAAAGMVYPSGTGIASVSSGTSWGTTYTTSGSGTVLALATSPVLTTPTITTSINPSTDDGAYLGQSGTGFSDLFLASGGVINWNAGNATLTHSAGLLTSNVPLSLGTSNALTAGTIELGHATDTTIARSGAGAITVEGVQVLLSGAALGTPSGGTVTNLTGTASININGTVGATTPSTGVFTNLSLTSTKTTETTTSSPLALNVNSLTSGTGLYAASSSLSSGSLFDLAITGTAGLTNQKGINVSLSGTNGVVGLLTAGENIFTNSTPVASGHAEIIANAEVSSTTPAHSDYTDAVTFIATASF